MIQSLMTRLQGQKGMEKTMVVMVFLLLVGLGQASLSCKEDKECRRDVCIDLSCKPRSTAGGSCNSNSHCISSANSCINEMCSLKSPPGGTCDANDGSDCDIASSTCSANNLCLSPTDGQCFQNDQCSLSSDSCIGQKCKAKANPGGTCDANDGSDCAVASSTCSSANNICLSLTDGQCFQNDQCALSSDSCIGQKCKPKSPPGGTCDANDNPDCAVASSTCSANNLCLSPTDGQCFQNDQCALSSDSCIGQKCKPKSPPGGTCDANDNADCVSGYKCVGTSCVFDLPSFKWEGNKAMAIQRDGAASVAVGGFLFVFGGQLISNSVTNSVEMYDPSSNTWVSKANMPVSTWKHSVVAVGNFVYLIGGADIGSGAQNNFFRYDTVNDVWTTLGELPVLPASLHSMAATVVGSTIFTLGGQSGSSAASGVNSIFSFDTSSPSSQWTTTLPSLPLTLTQASAVSVGSMIYITGGSNSGGTVQSKTFKFDTAALPLVAPQDANLALTVGRSYHASFFNSISNKIHLVGGVTYTDRAKTMETLDLNNPSPAWTSEPTAILNLIETANSGGLINNRIYLPGSARITGFSASSILNVLDITSSPKWVPFAPSPTPTYFTAVGKVGSSIITGGGYAQNVAVISRSFKYDIPSDTWSSLPGATLPGRAFQGSAVVGSEVYSIGGDNGFIPVADTFALNAPQTAWIQKANLNVPRSNLCAASEGNSIFAFGGLGSSGSIRDTMEIYDASLNTWTDVTSSSKSLFTPTAVHSCAAVSTGTKILIFGGYGNSGSVTRKIQSFDILTQKWDAPITTSFISARYSLSATVLNGFVIVTGGTTTGSTALAKVEAYEISTGLVSSLPDMPSPRFSHGSVTDGDSVLVVGGKNGGLLAPLEKFRAFP